MATVGVMHLHTEGKRMLPTEFEPISPLDPKRPLRALSLPAWLQRSVNALTADCLNPMIQASLALSEEQRRAVQARVDHLGEAEIAADVDETMMVAVELLEAFPAAKLSDEQARLKAKGYITALEGVPTWAVAEARRRWLQARAGLQNYDFAPTPPRLREVADEVLVDVRAQRLFLQRLLKAKPVREEKQDPETQRRINEGYAELLARLKTKVRPIVGAKEKAD
jgi:hypothetical protein